MFRFELLGYFTHSSRSWEHLFSREEEQQFHHHPTVEGGIVPAGGLESVGSAVQ